MCSFAISSDGQVDRLVPQLVEPSGQRRGIPSRLDPDSDEDVRPIAATEAIVELGDDAAADRGAELAERARPLRDRHREHRLSGLPEIRPFGHEPQPVEVHVGAAEDGDETLACHPLALDVGPQPRDRQRPGRLRHGARVVEDVLEGGADLVVGHPDDLIDDLRCDGER